MTNLPKAKPAPLPTTDMHLFGEIVRMMTGSPAHQNVTIATIKARLMPAINNRQFFVFREGADNRPVGYALWALLSEEAEGRLKDPANKAGLKPEDWHSGDRIWLLELNAPYANEANAHIKKMLAHLTIGPLKGKVFRFFGNGPDGTRSEIVMDAAHASGLQAEVFGNRETRRAMVANKA